MSVSKPGNCGAKMDLSMSDTCPNCGAKAGAAARTSSFTGAVPSSDSATFGLDENVASAACYALWWLTGIIFLLVEKDNKTVRFHAMQSILTFLPLNILAWIIGSVVSMMSFGYYGAVGMWGIVGIIGTIIFIIELILWLVLMYKAYMGEKFMVPIAGPIAANQLK